MGTNPFGRRVSVPCRITLACEARNAYWPEGQAIREGYDLRSRMVRHKWGVVRLCYFASVRILQVSSHGVIQLYEERT